MKIIQKIKNFFVSIENMLSTEHSCISCLREIPDGSKFQMCDKCYKKLDRIYGNVCSKCGEMLIDGNLLCSHCKDFDYEFNSNKSICYYDDISSSIIKALKYDNRKYYAKHIAILMTENREVFEGVDYITFVPMTDNRKKVRGFNQSEEIANEVSKIVNIEVKKFLIKTKDNKHQAGLSQKDRLNNLKGTFEFNDEFLSFAKNKNILLIDDVFTTGATLSECSKILKKSKPKSICTLTFAKTKLYSLN